jgi:outer membrane biosynthesis protein TonB
MANHRSMRGIPIDLGKLMSQQEKNITVGNTKTNARGDQLGRGGRVVKSADAIAREHYNQNPPKQTKKASIKTDDVVKKQQLEDDWVEPAAPKKSAPKADPIVSKKEEPEVDPNFNTDADPWIEDADGNFVRASELAESNEDESVSKSKKTKS